MDALTELTYSLERLARALDDTVGDLSLAMTEMERRVERIRVLAREGAALPGEERIDYFKIVSETARGQTSVYREALPPCVFCSEPRTAGVLHYCLEAFARNEARRMAQ